MMFKGTKRRPTTLTLSKELDSVGAEFNAFTGKDTTAYLIKADCRHLSLAIDILSDMLLHSKFDAEELKKEKGVIVEEINMYEDNPLMSVEEMLEEIMFSGNSLGRMIAGSRETVRAVKRTQMVAFKNKYYQGRNIVIGLAGNFLPAQVEEIKNKFSFLAGSKKSFTKLRISQQTPRVKVKYKETEQVQLALGWPAYSYFDERIYPLQLLSVILGGNMSSRLFINVREKNGLAYFIHSGVNVYEDTGSLVIQAGLDKTRLELAIKTILAETEKMKHAVSAVELKRAKDFISGKVALDLEDSLSIARWYASQELMTGKIMTPKEKLERLGQVTVKEIQQVAKEIFNKKRLSLALVGPFKDEKKFKKIIR
jgi:predicted Zn-dependent peptidase